jgi:hypothetical protein
MQTTTAWKSFLFIIWFHPHEIPNGTLYLKTYISTRDQLDVYIKWWIMCLQASACSTATATATENLFKLDMSFKKKSRPPPLSARTSMTPPLFKSSNRDYMKAQASPSHVVESGRGEIPDSMIWFNFPSMRDYRLCFKPTKPHPGIAAAFMRLCVYEGGLFSITGCRSAGEPHAFPSLKTVRRPLPPHWMPGASEA